MDQLRRIMAGINKQLKPTTASFKVAVIAIVMVVIMGLLFIIEHAGKPDMQELLPGTAAPDQLAAKSHLDAMGIKNELQGGKLFVASGDVVRAKALLAESGGLPSDKSLMFETLLARQSWTNSKQQNEQNYLVA